MEYTERMKEKYMAKVDKINKIDDEGTRVHLKLKLMADVINELSKNQIGKAGMVFFSFFNLVFKKLNFQKDNKHKMKN